jgi:hypothetical protein
MHWIATYLEFKKNSIPTLGKGKQLGIFLKTFS